MPYLTPDNNPVDKICRVLFIPNDLEFLAIVTGALQELTFEYNFEEFGAVTVDQTVEAFNEMFDGFCFNEGTCRVIGELIAYAGSASPDPKWLVCDGSSQLRTDYPDLFIVIGTNYGSIDGAHFNLPDLRGRAISGVGTGPGLSSVALGDAYGEQDHILTVGELAIHAHVDAGHSHAEGNAAPTVIAIGVGVPAPSAIPSIGITGSASANIGSTGNDDPHNTVGPRLGINYLIVAL